MSVVNGKGADIHHLVGVRLVLTSLDLTSSLTKLSLSSDENLRKAVKGKKSVADSWDDDETSDSDEEDGRPLTAQESNDLPSAPPPTPVSPTSPIANKDRFISPYDPDIWTQSVSSPASPRSERPSVRPEKTDAVAKRLIAGALGVRAPKKTEEQRAYDRAMREKEMRKRNAEKEAAIKAKEDEEKAKQAIWSD